jgi:hypothetical protein
MPRILHSNLALAITLLGGWLLATCGDVVAAEPSRPVYGNLPLYQPSVTPRDIYYPHPGKQPFLRYNHDVDIVKFKGRFLAAWNANEQARENVPGQYNFLSVSDDFETWSTPVRLFRAEAGSENPVESDNQWQPIFINDRDQTLLCAWCDYVARRTFVSTSTDGLHWRNRDVATAPSDLEGKVVGFPTNHGLLTSKGVMLFPCSLPVAEDKLIVGHTRYAGILRSEDRGATWHWSDPIEAIRWSEVREDPKRFGGETIYLWEPAIFEQGDGRIGLLIRNSTAQDDPEREELPHRMLLYASSPDQGKTWTKARPVEVDTICSRNYSVAGVGTPDSLLMVMNDNNVRVPERISHDRYHLSLYLSPVCDPDLLLPGPIVQPEGGTAFYPNGFVDDGKLYVAYTYAGIRGSVIEPLPDFSRPMLLPRGGRSGLRIEGRTAYVGHRHASLGLVLTQRLTHQEEVRLEFKVYVDCYNGLNFPILSLGGKTHNAGTISVEYSKAVESDVFLFRVSSHRAEIPFEMGRWNHCSVVLGPKSTTFSVNGSDPVEHPTPVLRKVCFGGLYVRPRWPMGMERAQEVRLDLDSITVR